MSNGDGTATATTSNATARELSNLLDLIRSEARIAILQVLAGSGELCVAEIQERLGKSRPHVSFHLALLRASGLVEARRGRWDGRRAYYRVLPDRIRRLRRLIDGLMPRA